jgi:hypothetical protein
MKNIRTYWAPALAIVASATLLTACGSAEEETYSVGSNASSSEDVVYEADEIPMVDIVVTELPPSWPDTIPVPPQGEIANVVEVGDSIAVTWRTPKGEPMDLAEKYVDALMEAGFDVGESDATEFYGKGEFSNDTHTVFFNILSVTEDTMEYYVTYAPRVN